MAIDLWQRSGSVAPAQTPLMTSVVFTNEAVVNPTGIASYSPVFFATAGVTTATQEYFKITVTVPVTFSSPTFSYTSVPFAPGVAATITYAELDSSSSTTGVGTILFETSTEPVNQVVLYVTAAPIPVNTASSAAVSSSSSSTPTTTNPTTSGDTALGTTTTSPTVTSTGSSTASTTHKTSSGSAITTSLAASNSLPPATSKGVTAGAAAGIGIGCAIIGALLAFALAWCILGRKRKNQRSPIPEREHFVPSPDYGNANTISKAPLTEKVLPISGPQSEALDGFLPQRADDSQLKKGLQDLNEIIDQHVENHYHNKPFEGNQGALERRLVECGYTSDVAEVTAILVNPQTRFAGIRQLIAKVIIGNTDLKARSDLSLLPPQIAAFCSSIPPVERQSGSEDVFGHVLSRWRYLTSYLLSPNRSSRLPPSHSESPDPALHANITRNVAVINSALKLFINPGAESQRYQENNLSAIVFEGAKLGLLIFSQPSELLYRWTSGPAGAVRRKGRGFVVFPGLWESVSERKARDISQPVVIDL